ncbi:MAG: glycosyltransferase, partial [Rikenellaceae bacterium]
MSRQLVIIPTYNEKENVENVIGVTLSLQSEFDILIVDDGSPDGTADIVKKIIETQSRVNILERQGKLGLGTAYLTGFKWA